MHTPSTKDTETRGFPIEIDVPFALYEELPTRAMQELWFALLQRKWSSLAIVPLDAEVSASNVARSLVAVAQLQSTRTVTLIDAECVQAGRTAPLIREMAATVLSGGLVVVAVDAFATDMDGFHLVTAADAVLLCVSLGVTRLAAARRAVDLIGRDKVIGSLVRKPVSHGASR